jgi:hypothetical protein
MNCVVAAAAAAVEWWQKQQWSKEHIIIKGMEQTN